MSIQIVSVANRIPDRNREPYYRFQTFVDSLARFGVKPGTHPGDLLILGMNEWWGGLMTKPRRLRDWLRGDGCKCDTLIVCDAFDIVFSAPPAEIEAAYERWEGRPGASGPSVVFNAERGLFPRPELAHAFSDNGLPWRYLNSGFFIGPPAQILALLEAMWLDDIADDYRSPDQLHGGGGRMIHPNDQGWYQLMYAAQVVPMDLDSRGEIAQCLSACTLDEFDLSGPRIRNLVTGTEPLVWHFNGGSKNDLMPVFLQKWGIPT
jgi:hypothetical protein